WDPVFSGYYDSCFSDWRVKSDAKTLCTHLDMLTAALLLHDAAGESRCLDRARRLADLTTGMMDPGRGCVLERFTREWIYDPAPIRDRIQFGHNLKAAWLLLKLFRLTEHAPYLETARRLLAFCLDRGWDEPHGGFFQHAYRSGAPASRVKEWWPECEGMMALAWMHRITGDDRYKERFIRLAHFTFNAFWDRIHGEWVLACHPDGSVQNSVKGCAWKAAYHTVQACHEIWRLLEE
ncbi:MAG: hypothetical protein GY859_23450, partial [Desulfobacterales bacterium]|nr:hypothetical protein [Desulfobacterales bacterium]